AYLFAFFFLFSSYVVENLLDFWNPSFLFFFIACIYYFRSRITSVRGWLYLGLLLGLSVQIHLIAFFYLLESMLILYRSKVNYSKAKSLALLITGLLLPLIPYFLNRPTASGGLSTLLFNFKTSLYHLLMIPEKSGITLAFIGLSPFVVLALYYAYLLSKKRKFQIDKDLMFGFVAALPLSLFLFHGLYFKRYTIPLLILFLMIIAVVAHDIFKTKSRRDQISLIAVFIIMLFCKWMLPSFQPEVRDNIGGRIKIESARKLTTFIAEKTNWSLNTFLERTYVQGIDREADIAFFYYLETKKLHPTAIENIGALIYRDDKPLDVSCEASFSETNFKVCLYRTEKRLNNLGNIYYKTQTPDYSPALVKNFCDTPDSRCSIYFQIKIKDSFIHVSILGDPLAASDVALNPIRVESLVRPKLKVFCPNEAFEFTLAEKIGYDAKHNSFLTPFDFSVKLPCKNPTDLQIIASEGASYRNNYVRLNYEPFTLSGKDFLYRE
ncbi:MAG: hypothetical protein ABL930_10510, partial [Pseudobdellovibrio sp.]